MTPATSQTLPLLNGLVLTGGKSTRMGIAKESIHWHGKEQQYAMADLLMQFCSEVFISCRPDQLTQVDAIYSALPDSFPDIGPLGGILSAMHFQKDKAWLIVACDIPLMDAKALDLLVRFRDHEKVATTYESPENGYPEPLVTIWEPKSLSLLMDFIKTGNHSPRKFLMSNDILMLKPENPKILRNVNTPKEAAEMQRIIKKNEINKF